jgi:hypothetical protein
VAAALEVACAHFNQSPEARVSGSVERSEIERGASMPVRDQALKRRHNAGRARVLYAEKVSDPKGDFK